MFEDLGVFLRIPSRHIFLVFCFYVKDVLAFSTGPSLVHDHAYYVHETSKPLDAGYNK